MKIQKIESFVVQQTLEESFSFSQWEYQSRSICLVKVTLENGLYGWGEGYGPSGLVKAGIDFFRPFLLGQNALETENLWEIMYRHSLDYARRGVMLASLSAIDVALWDLKGKLLDCSVSVLLGGRKREEVQAYATGLYFTEGNGLAKRLSDEAQKYREQGFHAVKMKVGLSIQQDIQNVQAVRESLGEDIHLMVDANHAYSFTEACQLARELERFNISWFEEPVSPENYNDYAELRLRTSIPIAGGECEYLRNGFLTLFQSRSVDIAQPDICAAGGITEVKKIADMAKTFGVQIVPHTWGTGIAIAAALQLAGNIEIGPGRLFAPDALIELDQTENLLRDELTQPCFKPQNGKLQIPNAPGLGVDVDKKLLEHFLSE
ncbi:mandelate racemase/muconate lactonizing enzyme family protein [hydrothermal vent metagenome]|uniref:Mandelate racemase/muconate lactonizing enzyme family protein n=1 Tax=hydrothermal vent metagenome TaxID=652676 RepID=A0A3B1DPB9_9ZZZZ